jgi:hypothetical protein
MFYFIQIEDGECSINPIVMCYLFVVCLSQVDEPGENCIMRRSIIYSVHRILLGSWSG